MYKRQKPQPLQPLLLKVSFVLPHYPYFCSEDLFKYYLNRVPLYGPEQKLSGHPYLDTKHLEIGKDITMRDVQRTTAAYYGIDVYKRQVWSDTAASPNPAELTGSSRFHSYRSERIPSGLPCGI